MASDLSIDLSSVEQPDLTPLVKTRMPKLGEIVTYYEGDAELGAAAYRPAPPKEWTQEDLLRAGRNLPGTNGHRDHPAIVTAVWSASCVNLTVFFDASVPALRSSASLLPDFEPHVHCVNSGWRFQPD